MNLTLTGQDYQPACTVEAKEVIVEGLRLALHRSVEDGKAHLFEVTEPRTGMRFCRSAATQRQALANAKAQIEMRGLDAIEAAIATRLERMKEHA